MVGRCRGPPGCGTGVGTTPLPLLGRVPNFSCHVCSFLAFFLAILATLIFFAIFWPFLAIFGKLGARGTSPPQPGRRRVRDGDLGRDLPSCGHRSGGLPHLGGRRYAPAWPITVFCISWLIPPRTKQRPYDGKAPLGSVQSKKWRTPGVRIHGFGPRIASLRLSGAGVGGSREIFRPHCLTVPGPSPSPSASRSPTPSPGGSLPTFRAVGTVLSALLVRLTQLHVDVNPGSPDVKNRWQWKFNPNLNPNT